MNQPQRIPIFPLDVVLFPGMPLPLHIFEPRYKSMTRRCIAEHLPFGLILAGERGMATVGTTAEIIQKVRDYPDGRMDILTIGYSIISVKQIFDSEEYYEALVDYLSDAVFTEDPSIRSELLAEFNRCHILLYGQSWSPSRDDEGLPLSYLLAARLPLDLLDKQKLLEEREESVRRSFLQQSLARLIPQIAERQRIRRSAGGNGHPVN
jgi:ATP-dependent Lon protease